jgi:hypothetical protein
VQLALTIRTDYNESLAATIELSLSSPTFLGLVVAFFPQGIHENNLYWLFPTISHIMNVFDKLCALS